MQPQLKHLGLTQLEKVLPTLFETARQEQWTYELFLTRAIAAEIEGRDRRAAERRMTAARLPTLKTLEAFDFSFQPSLSERLLWELADLSFVQTVGGLPLALDQAGAYVAETKCGLSDYLDLFKQRQKDLLDRRGTLAYDHPRSVVATFLLAFEQVQQHNKVGIDLLKLCAYLAPDAIPLEIFTKGATYLGTALGLVADDALQLDQALETLLAYSLVRRDGENRTLSIHRLVQAVLQDAMQVSEQKVWANRAIKAVESKFPGIDHTTRNHCERLLPHALACITHIPSDMNTGTDLALLLFKTAGYLHDRALYSEAEPLLLRALSILEQTPSSNQLLVASVLNDLALLYVEQGQYEQARPCYEKALLIQVEILGNTHPQVAYTLNNLAFLSLRQGDYEQAEQLLQCSKSVYEQVLGSGHLLVATSLSNLASLKAERRAYKQAEQLYQEALAMWEQAAGSEHPYKACLLYGLAGLYLELGRDVEAELFYQRALAACRREAGNRRL